MKRIISVVIILALFFPIVNISVPVAALSTNNRVDTNSMRSIDQSVLNVFNVDSYKLVYADNKAFNVNGISIRDTYREFLLVVDKEVASIISNKVYKIRYSIHLTNDLVLMSVIVSKKELIKLYNMHGVHSIVPSMPVKDLFGLERDKVEYMIGRENMELKKRDDEGIGTFASLDVMGVKKAWREYGVYGNGVIVGVVDTGIDFANPELGLDSLARDSNNYPLTVAVDEHLGLTPVKVVANSSGYLNTSGAVVPVYSTVYSGIYGYPVITYVTVDVDYKVSPEIMNMSKSGVFKFGFLEWFFIDWLTGGYIIFTDVPILLIDAHTSGVYDTVVFDLSTAFYDICDTMVDLENSTLGVVLWREPNSTWLDYSFADEPIISYGNEIIARDFDGDGYYDFSLGTLAGYYIDTWGTADYTWNSTTMTFTPGTPGQHKGLDPEGRFVAVFTDIYGHGTSVATIIAARGREYYNGYGGQPYKYYGVAPAAKLAGGTGFWFGDLIMAEYWLAGVDWYYSARYGLTPILSEKRSDIISNSWNYVNIVKRLHEPPGIDYFSYMINQLILACWDNGYNVTIVFAAGNEGPGFTTVSSPAAELLAITVGASTLFEYAKEYGYPPGYADDIIAFSSRGPNGLGYPKPDVVAIGAFEWAGIRTIEGRGYGILGYWEDSVGPGLTLFGGTSEATPFVSGILALGIEAYKWRFGYTPSPIELKTLLKSSADDINYPALQQGSGRVNAYKLVKTILEDDFIAYIPEGITEAFAETYGNIYYAYRGGTSYELYDTAYYDVVLPGSSSSFTLIVKGTGVVNVRAVTYLARRQFILFNGVYNFSAPRLFTIPHNMFKGYDYMEIYVLYKNVSLPYPYYGATPFNERYWIIVDAFDYYNGLMYRLNTEARVATTALLTIGDLSHRIRGDIIVRLRPPASTPPTPVRVKIIIRLYKTVRFSWVRFGPLPTYVAGEKTIVGYIRVPRYARPGIYEFKILVKTPAKTIAIPATILVPLVINGRKMLVWTFTFKSPLTYDSYTPLGLTDPYYGRFTEALDWRIIPVVITDTDITGVILFSKWRSGPMTSLEVVVTPPGGIIDPYGNLQTFAAYKLTGRNGYVYNPSMYDQLRGLLKLYIPVKWSIALSELNIYYHYYASPSSENVRSIYQSKMPTYSGLYRIMIAYGSYSGKRLFDTVRILFSVVKAYQSTTYDRETNTTYITAVFRASPLGLPFRNAKIYTITSQSINSPGDQIGIGYRRYSNGTIEVLSTINGTYLGKPRPWYYIVKHYTLTGSYTFIETVLVLKGIMWHASGIYYYDYEEHTIKKSEIYYPAIVTTTPERYYPEGPFF